MPRRGGNERRGARRVATVARMRSTQVVALGACAFVGWIGLASHAAAEELPVDPQVEQSAPAVTEEVAQSAPAVPDVQVAQSAPATPDVQVDQSAPAVPDEAVAQSAPAVDEPPIPTDPTSGSVPTGTLDDGSTVAQAGPAVPAPEQAAATVGAAIAAGPASELPETGQGLTLAVVAAALCAMGTSLIVASRRTA